MKPVIIVHGGAKTIPPEKAEAHRRGCHEAVMTGWKLLQEGGAAIDAVEAAIRVMEDDPTFNAGYGSDLNADGEVQMDAGIMEGSNLDAGAVGALQGVRHPISVAKQVLRTSQVFLVAEGARRFAREQEAELCPLQALVTEEQWQVWRDRQANTEKQLVQGKNTVGCVALDRSGNVAAGTSTGGTGNNPPGRIGDSPQVGAGLYADNLAGGVSFSGDGESIARVVLAKYVIDRLDNGHTPDEAAQFAIERLEHRVQGEGGCIVIDRHGRCGWRHNSSHMAVAYHGPDMSSPCVFLSKGEEGHWQSIK